MSAHLSSFALDEAAAGLPVDADARTHLDGCASCAQRVDALKRENARLLASPHGAALGNKLVGRFAEKPQAPPRRWIIPALSALAAGVLLFVFVPRPTPTTPDPDRLKGTAAVAIVRDGQPVTQANVGERVGLQLSSAGMTHAAVFALEDGGAVALWPTEAKSMSKLSDTGVVLLPNAFEVTKGSITVHAAFANEPLPLAELEAQLRTGAADSRVRWVKTTLEVP